ncbi:MAG TPA: hypothetical protein PLV87_13210 [Opitutaceae bacterium]|nr:hypothetical protein [Opitutaceae bacterium]
MASPKKPEPPAKRKGAVPEYVTAIDLAAHLSLSTKRIQQLSQEGVLDRQGRGKYEFSKAVQAYIKYKTELSERQNQSSSADRLRDRREQKEALRIAREERELIHIEEADAGMQEVCGAILDFVSSLPARITRDVRERQRIERICDEGRLRLSDRFAKARRVVRHGVDAAEATDEDAA